MKSRIIRYELPGEWTVLAGATSGDNDRLSTEIAAAEDWWFHAEGIPGSHVILLAKADENPSRETVRQAAAIAAYHSKARRAGRVRVHYTRVRHVRKPRGARPGTVEVARGDVLQVHPDISFAKRVRNESISQP